MTSNLKKENADELKNKHILQQDIGKLGKKGLQRVIMIESMLRTLIKEYERIDNEVKLLQGQIELLI